MYSRNRFIILTGVILCFVCLPPIEAQDDTSRAIASLIKVSEVIDKDNTLNPQTAVSGAWKNIPAAIKRDPDVLYCYALVRMKHSLESFEVLVQLKNTAANYSESRKAHIHAAFRDKGAVAGCNLIKSYVRDALRNEKESAFTLWAVVMTETISRNDKIQARLKPLLDSPAYVAFKQNNKKLNTLLKAAGINFDDQLLDDIRTLNQQVIHAKKLLKDTEDEYFNKRTVLLKAIEKTNKKLFKELPRVTLDGFNRVLPDPYYGFVFRSEIQVVKKAVANQVFVPQPIKVYYVTIRDFNPPGELVTSQTLLRDDYLFAVNGELRPTIIKGGNLRTTLSQLDLNMTSFIKTLMSKYSNAIKEDPVLSAAIKGCAARIPYFSNIAALNKQQQKQENQTLKLLAEKLLPLIDFSAEKELKKF
jgi:hypothetical protein